MKTIVNYAKDERRSFKEYPFNDADSLVLSTIAYFDFVKEMIGCIIGPDEKSIIKLLAEKDKAINELKTQYNKVKSLLNSENLVK